MTATNEGERDRILRTIEEDKRRKQADLLRAGERAAAQEATIGRDGRQQNESVS